MKLEPARLALHHATSDLRGPYSAREAEEALARWRVAYRAFLAALRESGSAQRPGSAPEVSAAQEPSFKARLAA
jgi:hypothetical protein